MFWWRVKSLGWKERLLGSCRYLRVGNQKKAGISGHVAVDYKFDLKVL